jgi:hypothetical protein
MACQVAAVSVYNVPMADPEAVRAVANAIIAEVEREFPGAKLELDFDRPAQDHEDAYLWVSAAGADDDDVADLWGFVIERVQRAFQDNDVYLVARMRDRAVVVRDRPYDKE